jgi:hypothetical protein
MFKNIQKYLLLNHPLLWNTKVVPALTFAILFHFLFFGIGYLAGGITFKDDYNNSFDDGIAIFFSVILSVLFFIVWFIFYIRNNGFKSFYPQKKHSLFKEWIIILLISMLNISYSMSYLAGKKIHTRSYFTQKEIKKRSETIMKASVFIEGSFGNSYDQENVNKNGDIIFNKKAYHQNSLMNKNIDEFYGYNSYRFGPTVNGKINLTNFNVIVKTWMQNDNQVEIKKLMQDYFIIIKDHKLSTNLSPEKWFDLTYHYPDFMGYENIARSKVQDNEAQTVTANETDVEVATNNKTSKYYLPQDVLKDTYDDILKAWDEPIIDFEILRVLLYIGIGFSIFLFSFKVTNGRSFIIALVSAGVLWMMVGIVSVISRSVPLSLFFMLALFCFMCIFFFTTVAKNKGKSISDIILNLLLWSLSGFLPLIYSILMVATDETEYSSDGNLSTQHSFHTWLDDQLVLFSWLNFVMIVIFMFLMTIYIKKWKGIAES